MSLGFAYNMLPKYRKPEFNNTTTYIGNKYGSFVCYK